MSPMWVVESSTTFSWTDLGFHSLGRITVSIIILGWVTSPGLLYHLQALLATAGLVKTLAQRTLDSTEYNTPQNTSYYLVYQNNNTLCKLKPRMLF